MMGWGDDRVFEATPARRRQAIDRGHGPRAPWLASAVSGLLAVGLLSIAAGPVSAEARAWLRQSLVVTPTPQPVSSWDVLMPAITGALAVCLAALASSLLVHGPWIRLARPAFRRSVWLHRLRGSLSSLGLAGVSVAVGVLASLPWLPGLARLGARSLHDGLWAMGAFVSAVALASLLAIVALGLLQWRLASRRFDRMLRMTHAEAREAAKDERPRAAVTRAKWRLA
jgi:hypothetical protein